MIESPRGRSAKRPRRIAPRYLSCSAPQVLSITKTHAFHVLYYLEMDTLCCLMGWAGSLIGLSSHSSRRLSGQLRHQKTGVLAYKTPDYVFSFKAFLTYHFLTTVILYSACIEKSFQLYTNVSFREFLCVLDSSITHSMCCVGQKSVCL